MIHMKRKKFKKGRVKDKKIISVHDVSELHNVLDAIRREHDEGTETEEAPAESTVSESVTEQDEVPADACMPEESGTEESAENQDACDTAPENDVTEKDPEPAEAEHESEAEDMQEEDDQTEVKEPAVNTVYGIGHELHARKMSHVPHAHWIHQTRPEPASVNGVFYLPARNCSRCGYESNNYKAKCPQCGAIMDEK